MSNDNTVHEKRATTILTAYIKLKGSPDTEEEYYKEVVSKLKNSSTSERSEMKHLNQQLENYLSNVRALEAQNKRLIVELERAREAALPKIVDKTREDELLEKERLKLEDASVDAVSKLFRIEEVENLTKHIDQRTRFFQNEAQLFKNKLESLKNQVNDMTEQKEFLKKCALETDQEIAREKERAENYSRDLENLISNLKENRFSNKKLEFEMQTILDEIEFRKATFNEEANEIRSRLNGLNGLSGVDLVNFYRTELGKAIRQIRQDFQIFHDQKLAEYKDQKETELGLIYQRVEENKNYEKLLKARHNATTDIDIQDASQLRSSIDGSKSELSALNAENQQLTARLASLESRLEELRSHNANEVDKKRAEIDRLKEENREKENELEYWLTVTRAKLEREIITYRVLLNSQIRILQTPLPPRKPSVQDDEVHVETSEYQVTTVKFVEKTDGQYSSTISDEALLQAFKKFDADNSGFVSAAELKDLMASVGQRFNESQITQLLASVDKDKDGTLNYQEFVQLIRKPLVFVGDKDKTKEPENESNKPKDNQNESKPNKETETLISSAVVDSGVLSSDKVKNEPKPAPINVVNTNTTTNASSNQLNSTNQTNNNLVSSVLVESNLSNSNSNVKETQSSKPDVVNQSASLPVVSPTESSQNKGSNSGLISSTIIESNISSPNVSPASVIIGANLNDPKAQANNNSGPQIQSQTPNSNLVSSIIVESNLSNSADSISKEKTTTTNSTALNASANQAESVNKEQASTSQGSFSVDVLRQIFDFFDTDKSGKVNSSEFDAVLNRLGVNLTKEAYDQILKEADKDASRDIDFEEFCKIMKPVFTGNFEDKELYGAFKKFDLDNSGHISVDELRKILSEIGQNFSDNEIATMIAKVDADKDGKLNFQEFARLMKNK